MCVEPDMVLLRNHTFYFLPKQNKAHHRIIVAARPLSYRDT
jgi:hypothetical protein